MSFLNSQRKRCSLPISVLLVSFMAKIFLHWSILLYFQLLLHWCFLNSLLDLANLFNIFKNKYFDPTSLPSNLLLSLSSIQSQTACSLPPCPSIPFTAWPSAVRLCHHNFIAITLAYNTDNLPFGNSNGLFPVLIMTDLEMAFDGVDHLFL